MYVSMNNIISKRFFNGKKWVDIRKERRIKALNKIKVFLLSTCKAHSQTSWAIANMNINNLPRSAGIMDRLTTDGYIAGQDYPGELRFVKNWIKKYCY